MKGSNNMENNIVRLQYNDKELILVPTAHVSKNSAELVKKVIEDENPDSICIELDADRFHSLKNKKSWEDTNITQVIKDKKAGFLLVNLVLGNYQKKIAKQLGSNSGQEMIEGIKASEERNIPLVLADRSIQTTFSRIWASLNIWDKANLLSLIIFSMFEKEDISEEDLAKLQQEDNLTAALQEITKEFPKISHVLVHERDMYLAHKVKNAPGKKVVAILGAAHIIGMKEEIYKDYSIKPLEEVPPKKASSKILGYAIPVILILAIVLTFTQNTETGIRQIGYWFLWNGSLSALGCIIALAHPLTTLITFLCSPIGALSPVLANGWFGGLAEAYFRKPTVKDFENISTDLQTMNGIWKNKITKILLVVVLANIGSTIGTLIGGIGVIQKLIETIF